MPGAAPSWAGVALAVAPPLAALACCLGSVQQLRASVLSRQQYGADRAAAATGDPSSMEAAAGWLATHWEALTAAAMMQR